MSALAWSVEDGSPERLGRWIAEVQAPTGMIARHPGGPADPWNHVEAAMALAATGHLEAASRAIDWLVDRQDRDGGFPALFGADGEALEAHRDTNATAYLACGLAQLVAATGSAAPARRHRRAFWAAIGFVLEHQLDSGAIAWSIEADGTTSGDALLAASSAIHLSLGAAASLASALGEDPAFLVAARARLRSAIGRAPGGFLDKSQFAMDWYYPVLAGAIDGHAGVAHLSAGWGRFIDGDLGVRCRADGRWVTAAETGECALAHWRVGEHEIARRLLSRIRPLVLDDGAVRTGVVLPGYREFPAGEVTTYSAAALALAKDALRGGPSATVFSS